MSYPSDISDKEWKEISIYFRRHDARGCKGKYETHAIVNAIMYIAKTGCQWRYLPHDFPPWTAVYKRFERWNKAGVWFSVLEHLTKASRKHHGRHEHPSYGIIDSQSVKTAYGSEERGFHGGKKNQGT